MRMKAILKEHCNIFQPNPYLIVYVQFPQAKISTKLPKLEGEIKTPRICLPETFFFKWRSKERCWISLEKAHLKLNALYSLRFI